MERAVFVYTTFPSVVEAEKAGNDLVGARLAACVNILPGMISIYRWQGDRKSTRLNSSHIQKSRMPSSA